MNAVYISDKRKGTIWSTACRKMQKKGWEDVPMPLLVQPVLL